MTAWQGSATLSGSGSLAGTVTAALRSSALLSSGGAIHATVTASLLSSAQLGGVGLTAGTVTAALMATARLSAEGFSGAWMWPPIFTQIPLSALFAGQGSLTCQTLLLSADPLWPGIDQTAGSELIAMWSPTGLEKAMADVEGQHLISIYAELVRDQWDPYAISAQNLPYLAWAMGVNLWEDNWSVAFRRWWVANQWILKYQRGSLLGISNFVAAVGGEITKAWVPPSFFYPGAALTAQQWIDFLELYPQLRLYPYAPAPTFPYLCYMGGHLETPENQPWPNHNGYFIGPLQPMYPTRYDVDYNYMQLSELVEPDGTTTVLTVQKYQTVNLETDQVTEYTQVCLPAETHGQYCANDPTKFLLPVGHPLTDNIHGIFLGDDTSTEGQIVNVPKIAPLAVTVQQLTFQTISPGMTPIDVIPQFVFQVHERAPYGEFYCGGCLTQPINMPPSTAWMFIYQLWYLFDPTIVPDYRQVTTFMGNARFGVPKYTAELLIADFGTIPPFYMTCGGFMYGYMPPPDTSIIESLRRAVRASKALRDTVLINTEAERVVSIADAINVDGSFSVGSLINA